MTKLSDLENIRERRVLLTFIPKPHNEQLILHITRREGDDGNITRNLTNCGRVIDYYNIFTKDEIDPDDSRFIYCPRCGKLEDFEAALKDYWTWWLAWRKEMDEQEAALAAENERLWNAYIRELEILQDNLEGFFPTLLDKKNGRVIIQTSEHEEEWLQVVKYRKDWS